MDTNSASSSFRVLVQVENMTLQQALLVQLAEYGATAHDSDDNPDVIIVDDAARCAESQAAVKFLVTDAPTDIDCIPLPLKPALAVQTVKQWLRLHAENHKLARECDLLYTVIDNLPDFIYAKDTEGRFILSNTANVENLGITHPRDILGKTDFDIYPRERAERYTQHDRKVIGERRVTWWEEVVIDNQTEQERWYDIIKIPVENTQDQVTGIVGLIRDITLRKQAENEMLEANTKLAELNQLRSYLLLMISHELRTPLNNILGYTEILLANMMGDLNDKQRDRIERVHRNGKNLRNIIDDILNLSKVQTGQMILRPELIRIEPTISSCVADFLSEAHAKGLYLRQEIPEDLPPVLADVTALDTVLSHVVGNAVKFTESGGITVEGIYIPPNEMPVVPDYIKTQSGPWVIINVKDTGIGIDAQDPNTLFSEFRQVEMAPTRRYEGTGLGLAVSRHLVELMDGQIWYISEAGKGSTFSVMLPVAVG